LQNWLKILIKSYFYAKKKKIIIKVRSKDNEMPKQLNAKIISNILGVSNAENIEFEGLHTCKVQDMIDFIKTNSEEFLGYESNILNAGWHEHNIGLAFFDNYLVYTNTGGKSDNHPGSFIIPISQEEISITTEVFQFSNGFSAIIEQMQRQLPEIYRLINNPDNKSCIYLPQKPQKRGNCTKSNPLKNYKALILLQEAKAENMHNSIEELSGFYRGNESSITAKYKGLSQHIREEALKMIDFSTPGSIYFSLANQYMLQHRNSQKPFYKSAVKYILQKQLESDGYNITQAENPLESKSGGTNTANVILSDEQVGAFITGLKNNPYISTTAELNFQRYLVFSSGSITEAELLTKDETGNTPLHTAIQKKEIGTVILLINYLLSQDGLLERNLAIANDLGKTPLDYINETDLEHTNGRCPEPLLHIATRCPNSELFDFLLEQKGIDVNVMDLNHITPLGIATKNKDYTKMTALLDKQAISEDDLTIAVKNEDITAINILLEYGAEINITYNSTNNPLHAAIISENLDIINLLLTQIQEQGQGDLVKYILDDCNSQEPFYKSAVKYILQKQLESDGYNITQAENPLESKSKAANTANITLNDEQVELFITGLKNNPNIVTTAEYDFQRHLFAQSIGLTNPRDYVAEFKYDSLHSAIKDSSNSVAIKHLFFSSGSINAEELMPQDEKGNTPLHTAIQKEDFGTVIFLTEHLSQEGLLKRNLGVANNLGKTPLEHINEQGVYLLHTAIQTEKPVFKYLFNDLYLESKVINEVINVKNESGNTLLHFETVLTDSDLLSFLLDQKIVEDNIDIRSSGGDTPLCTLINNLCLLKGSLSTSEKMEEIIKLLLHGADINNLNENKDSLLHLIISLSPSYDVFRKHVIIRLINSKKEILVSRSLNHQNVNKDTPLHVAARGGDVEYVKLLLSYGAQTDICNNDGKTFIDIARETLASFSNQRRKYRFFNDIINQYSDAKSIDPAVRPTPSSAIQEPAIATSLPSEAADTAFDAKTPNSSIGHGN
jgi:ankyrin repeat protein